MDIYILCRGTWERDEMLSLKPMEMFSAIYSVESPISNDIQIQLFWAHRSKDTYSRTYENICRYIYLCFLGFFLQRNMVKGLCLLFADIDILAEKQIQKSNIPCRVAWTSPHSNSPGYFHPLCNRQGGISSIYNAQSG